MIALEQARQHLESLSLKQAVEAVGNTLDVAANKQWTYAEMLEQLLDTEVAARRERYLSTSSPSENKIVVRMSSRQGVTCIDVGSQ